MNRARALRGTFACVVFAAATVAGFGRDGVTAEPVADLHLRQLIREAFPFRAAPVAEISRDANAIVLEPGVDADVTLLPELTVVASIRERHMSSAIERDLLRRREGEFDWRTGGTLFRKDFRKFSIESGLHWSLISTASGNPGVRLDLLKIAW